MFDEWDADASGDLSQEEFNQAVYSRYDADQSSNLEETEVSAYCDDFGEEGLGLLTRHRVAPIGLTGAARLSLECFCITRRLP